MNWETIILASISSASTVALAWIAYQQTRAAVKVEAVRVATIDAAGKVEAVRVAAMGAAGKVEEVKADLKVQGATVAGKLEEIHTTVNGNNTKLQDQIKELHAEVLRLNKDNAQLKDGKKT